MTGRKSALVPYVWRSAEVTDTEKNMLEKMHMFSVF